MGSSTWLQEIKTWVANHPFKAPSSSDQQAYTQEVMQRVKSSPRPLGSRASALGRAMQSLLEWGAAPQLALALGGACAALLIGLRLWMTSPDRVMARIEQDAQLLAQLEEKPTTVLDETIEVSPAEMEAHLYEADQHVLMLAQASPAVDESAASGLEEEWQALDALDDDSTATLENDDELEDWLKELQDLDADILASS